jgi:hypothetical protein
MRVRDQPAISLRMPPDMRDWLEQQRRKLGERSINATVITLLEAARKENAACE